METGLSLILSETLKTGFFGTMPDLEQMIPLDYRHSVAKRMLKVQCTVKMILQEKSAFAADGFQI